MQKENREVEHGACPVGTCGGRCRLPMKEQDTKNPLWHCKILSHCPSRWGCGRAASAGQLQGPAAAPRVASFPLQEGWQGLCSTTRLDLGEEVGKKESQRSSQPSGIPQGGFGILPRTPAGVLPQGRGTAATGAEPPPQLLRCSSCLPG